MPVNTEGGRRETNRAPGKLVYLDQLRKPAQKRQKHQDQGDAYRGRSSLSAPLTWWTALLVRGLELLRWSLLLFHRLIYVLGLVPKYSNYVSRLQPSADRMGLRTEFGGPKGR